MVPLAQGLLNLAGRQPDICCSTLYAVWAWSRIFAAGKPSVGKSIYAMAIVTRRQCVCAGGDETVALYKSGKLTELLRDAGVTWNTEPDAPRPRPAKKVAET